MRKLFLLLATVTIMTAAYGAAPVVTAWNIREAVKSGDAAYLSGKIEWPKVKETLKISLAAAALDLPSAAQVGGEAPSLANPPSLWQRFKTYLGKGAVDRMVESYANAEGLPKLFSYRQSYRSVTGFVEEPRTLWNLPDRIQRAWSRVRRAEFTSPTRFEMEMEDKLDPGRSFAGTLELAGLEWKLVALHVRIQKPGSLTGTSVTSSGNVLARLRDSSAPRLAFHDGGDPMER